MAPLLWIALTVVFNVIYIFYIKDSLSLNIMILYFIVSFIVQQLADKSIQRVHVSL